MSNKHKNKMSKKQHQQHTGETTIRQLRQVPGVMSCIFEHKTRETTADFEWSGPQLNAIWPEVLAFFKWTNDTMHSESQVRLFVNVATQEWRAWAFPQNANLGMGGVGNAQQWLANMLNQGYRGPTGSTSGGATWKGGLETEGGFHIPGFG